MALTRTAGLLEICAYSGCTRGEADLSETRGNLESIHADLAAPIGAAAIVVNNQNQTATPQFGNFLVPMECGQEG